MSFPAARWPAVVYTLFTAGSVPASPSNLATSGFFGSSGRQTYSFAASGGTTVTLTVAGNLGNLKWIGGSNYTWDNQISPVCITSQRAPATCFTRPTC